MTDRQEIISADVILPSQQLVIVSYDSIDPLRVTMGDETHKLFYKESGRKILESTLSAPDTKFLNRDIKILSKKIMFSAATELNDFFKSSCGENIEPWQFIFTDDEILLTNSGDIAMRNLVSVELVTDFHAEGQRRFALSTAPVAPMIKTVRKANTKVKAIDFQSQPENKINGSIDVSSYRPIGEVSVKSNPLLLMLEQNLTGISLDGLLEAFPNANYRKDLTKQIKSNPNNRLDVIILDGKPFLVLRKSRPLSDYNEEQIIQRSQLNPGGMA